MCFRGGKNEREREKGGEGRGGGWREWILQQKLNGNNPRQIDIKRGENDPLDAF